MSGGDRLQRKGRLENPPVSLLQGQLVPRPVSLTCSQALGLLQARNGQYGRQARILCKTLPGLEGFFWQDLYPTTDGSIGFGLHHCRSLDFVTFEKEAAAGSLSDPTTTLLLLTILMAAATRSPPTSPYPNKEAWLLVVTAPMRIPAYHIPPPLPTSEVMYVISQLLILEYGGASSLLLSLGLVGVLRLPHSSNSGREDSLPVACTHL